MALAQRVVGRFHDTWLKHFDYWHPTRLQRRAAPRPQALP
jgi:hypothetical protein